jgi:hypothetical protein
VYIIWKGQNGDQAVAWAHDQLMARTGKFVQPPIQKSQVRVRVMVGSRGQDRSSQAKLVESGVSSIQSQGSLSYRRSAIPVA